ncbi:MAG: LPS assembly lipoprotein LptE [Candidatus Methylomirabilales bacterium]
MKKKSVVSISFLLLPTLLGACGYHGQVSLPGRLKRIHLAVSNTGAFRPGLQAALTHALTQRILGAGGRIVEEETLADATIQANITALESNPVAFDAKDIARRFRMAVVLDLQVIQRKDQVELAKEEIRGEAYYTAPLGITGTQVAEDEAIHRALRDLADKVVTRVVEPF